jgi:cysteinyl-tRNA synthetase
VLDNMTVSYDKLIRRIAELRDEGEVDQEAYRTFRAAFEDALCSDVNTSMAITVVYDLLKADINDKTKLALLGDFDQVLSLDLLEAAKARKETTGSGVDEELSQFIQEKIAERAAAKKEKDFARADAIRAELLARGVAIKDTREGVVWELV